MVDERSSAPAETVPSASITVFIVDDHDIVREGLHGLLSREPDMRVIGQSDSAEDALAQIEGDDPDVVIVDYRLAGMDGIALCEMIARRRFRAKVIILSGFIEEEIVRAALMAGAAAYVVKDVESNHLISAIRLAANGKISIDPKAASSVMTWATRLRDDEASVPLSPRQMDTLRLMAEGRSNDEIAEISQRSLASVKRDVSRILIRLGVHTRTEAAAAALRRGLV